MAVGRLVALYNDSEVALAQKSKLVKTSTQQVEMLKEALNETELRFKELEEERNQLSINLLEANQLSGEKDEKLLQVEETLKSMTEQKGKSLTLQLFITNIETIGYILLPKTKQNMQKKKRCKCN